MPDTDTKTCPECAEEVQPAAAKCKHCGHQFATPRNVADQVIRFVMIIVGFALVVGLILIVAHNAGK